MLALRLFLGLLGVILVLALLGYAVSRDRRWFRFATLIIKVGVALAMLMMLFLLLERLLMFV
jgi:uncharacterized membrane protein